MDEKTPENYYVTDIIAERVLVGGRLYRIRFFWKVKNIK